MLAPSEVQAIESALGELAAAVDVAEQAASDANPWLHPSLAAQALLSPAGSWSGGTSNPIYAAYDSLRAYADGLANTLESYRRQRDALVEQTGDDHEAVLALVEAAKRAAGSTPPAVALAEQVNTAPDLNAVRAAVSDTAAKVADAAKDAASTAWSGLSFVLKAAPWVVLVVVVLVAGAYVLPWLPRRRSADAT